MRSIIVVLVSVAWVWSMSDRPELVLNDVSIERVVPEPEMVSPAVGDQPIELSATYTLHSENEFRTTSSGSGDSVQFSSIKENNELIIQNRHTFQASLAAYKKYKNLFFGARVKGGGSEVGGFAMISVQGGTHLYPFGLTGTLGIGLAKRRVGYTGVLIETDYDWPSSSETQKPVQEYTSDVKSFIELGGAAYVIPLKSIPDWNIGAGLSLQSFEGDSFGVGDAVIINAIIKTRFKLNHRVQFSWQGTSSGNGIEQYYSTGVSIIALFSADGN